MNDDDGEVVCTADEDAIGAPRSWYRRHARHVDMLLVAAIATVGSFSLTIGADNSMRVPFLNGVELPATCMSRQLFNVRCPGCGLTHSFVHLADGDWSAAWTAHRLGWAVALVVLLQFPYRLAGIARGEAYPLGRTVPRWLGYALLAGLIVNWLFWN